MSDDLEKTAYRLRRIPGDWKEKQIEQHLKNEYPHENPSIMSLSCDPLRLGQQVATLSFESKSVIKNGFQTFARRGLPQRGDKPVSISSTPGSIRLELDSTFEGFTPLHFTKDIDCTMDIIALTGLSGHAFGSFKQSGHGNMWLRDYLPQDHKTARVFIYGDDTKKASSQSIDDLANTFKRRLKYLRAKSTPRPWVLVAFSLGGLVAKAAINMIAEDQHDDTIATFQSLSACLLFGVPNQGLVMRRGKRLFLHMKQPNLVDPLDERYSQQIDEINAKFYQTIRKLPNLQTFSFYETQSSDITVSRYSATQGRPWDEPGHRVFALDCTHRELVKFKGKEDKGYKLVLECLKDLPKTTRAFTSNENECLRSLAFPDMDWHNKISPHERTCHWLLDHPEFKTWCSDRQKCLWILGPPGSGKSTLMRYAMQGKEAVRGTIVAGFSASGKASSELQKRILGLYRSILYQLLQYFPAHLWSLAVTFKKRQETRGNCGEKWNWTETELENLLFKVLGDASAYSITQLFLFFDAIDELGYSCANKLVYLFNNLLEKHPQKELNLHISFSCRHYPDLYQGGLSICMEVENKEDIKAFVDNDVTLTRLGKPGQDIRNFILKWANGMFQWAAIALQKVSQLHQKGMHIAEILKTLRSALPEMNTLYGSILEGMERDEQWKMLQLFDWMLYAARPISLAELRQVLAIDPYKSIQLAEELHFYDIGCMYAVVSSISKGLARVTLIDGTDIETISDQFRATRISPTEAPKPRVDPRAGPAHRRDQRRIVFTHHSVFGFLVTRGLQMLTGVTDSNTRRMQANHRMAKTCINYIALEESQEWIQSLDRLVSRQDDGWCPDPNQLPLVVKHPLMSYAVHLCAYHYSLSGKLRNAVELYEFLKRAKLGPAVFKGIPTQNWYRAWNAAGDVSDLILELKLRHGEWA